MNLFLHGVGPDDDNREPPIRTDDALRDEPERPLRRGAHEPALRQEVVHHRRERRGRDRPGDAHLQPPRLLDHDLEQAAQLRPARQVAAQDPRPRRRGRPRQRALRGRRGRDRSPQAPARVRRPHAAPPADRHLLRAGREGERPLLRPQARREGAVDEEGLGLRPPHQQALHAQDEAHDPRGPRRVRRVLPARRAAQAQGHVVGEEAPRAAGARSPTTRSSPATR